MPQSIVHVALIVKDYDEAIEFYTRKLRFTVVEDTYQPGQDKRWVVVAPPGSNGTTLLLARASTPAGPAFVCYIFGMKRAAQCSTLIALIAMLAAQPIESGATSTGKHSIIDALDRVVDAQNGVLRWYGGLPRLFRHFLEPAAVVTAATRRPPLKILIRRAPSIALDDRLGRVDRVNLTPSVSALLEVEFDATGDYQSASLTHVFDPQTGGFTSELQEPFIAIDGSRFASPTLYGRRIGQASKLRLPIHGIAIGDAFAWSTDPFRVLDAVERAENQVPQDAVGLFIGDDLEIVPLSDDIDELIEFLIARESFLGPEVFDIITDPDFLARAWTNGSKRVLWLPVDFDEAPGSRFEQSPTTDLVIADATEWLEQISRGRSSLSVTYFPGVLRLAAGSLAEANAELAIPTFPSSYVDNAIDALNAYDVANGDTGEWRATSWDRIVVLVSDALMTRTGAVAAGAFTTFNRYMGFHGVTDRFFLQHELGHTFLFGHSNYLIPAGGDPSGPAMSFFPISWDFMGLSTADGDNRQHPPSSAKQQAFWFEEAEVADATAGGTFRLVSHDRGPAGFLRAVHITTDDRIYWVDMRRLWSEVPRLHNGVQVHYANPVPNTPDSNGLHGAVYVAAMPSPEATMSPILAGNTFEDVTRGVRIRVDATGMDPFIAGAFFADVTIERF